MENIEKILKFLKVDQFENGYGYGSGDGSGDGDGLKIKKLNDELIFYVDNVPTIFDRIHQNIAKGRIVNIEDFSTKSCYIVKNQYFFAHEYTIENALKTLQDKMYANMDIEQRMKEFRQNFNNKDKYEGQKFFEWHHILTGSCLAGRNNFVERNNYSLKKHYTVKEFIAMCENDYGGEIIKKLRSYYE